MNRLGVKLYLAALTLDEGERLFLETELGAFHYNSALKTWENFRFLGPENSPEAFGAWKIGLEEAQTIDTALNAGRFLLVKRDANRRNERVIVLNGYRLYGVPSFERSFYLA